MTSSLNTEFLLHYTLSAFSPLKTESSNVCNQKLSNSTIPWKNDNVTLKYDDVMAIMP